MKDSDGILLRLLNENAPRRGSQGLLGAGIISAVMGWNARPVLAMSTMFTKDIYSHYGREKYGEKAARVFCARGFIVVVTRDCVSHRALPEGEAGIFENCDPVCLLGLCGDGAGDDCRAVLETRHTKLGRAGVHAFCGKVGIHMTMRYGSSGAGGRFYADRSQH